ncbi:MAG: DegT/DnrJ/EryC1/StrS family aminotransferase [Candidatus Staskawiczbacteria bacterium]|nr:DegT/DnrJ/EryC1/StrS family aminotransferase [Candidatus Staskawiczbacteria bacterium]
MSKLAFFGGEPVRTKKFPAYQVIDEEEKKEVNRILDSGVLSRYLGCWEPDFFGGPEVQLMEKEWAEYFGVKHAVAVNSCTSGLQVAVGAAGISPGDEVIVSPYTMAASATAPLWYGAIPVFADIEKEYFCLDPESVKNKITPRTKAIIVVDIFGQPYNVEAINQIAKENNLIVIEDCAQAPGATYKGKYAGTLGDIGVYSLNYHKHIHTGEGGVIVTNDDKLANKLRLIRNHAEAVVGDKGETDLVNMVGANFRLTYSPKVREGASHVYYQQAFFFFLEIIGVSRDLFIKAVQAELPVVELRETEGKKVECGYVKPLYLLPLFQKKIAFGDKGFPFVSEFYHGQANYDKGLCPVAEKLHFQELFTHEYMRPPATKEDLDDFVKAFKKVYNNREELKKMV